MGGCPPEEIPDWISSLQLNSLWNIIQGTLEENKRQKRSRLSEQSLVKVLEDKGIGRPSTFAQLVSRIQQKGYCKVGNIQCEDYECQWAKKSPNSNTIQTGRKIKKGFEEKNKLIPTDLGRQIVNEFENTHLKNYFQIPYTSSMEDNLDEIAHSKLNWETYINSFETQFQNDLISAKDYIYKK